MWRLEASIHIVSLSDVSLMTVCSVGKLMRGFWIFPCASDCAQSVLLVKFNVSSRGRNYVIL